MSEICVNDMANELGEGCESAEKLPRSEIERVSGTEYERLPWPIVSRPNENTSCHTRLRRYG